MPPDPKKEPVMRTVPSRLFYHMLLTAALLLATGSLPEPAAAQNNDIYVKADRLLQQHRYEEAYPLFEQLFEAYPGTYMILEKATECLINLKEYEQAIDMVQQGLEQGNYPAQGNIRLGEIYHISGDTGRAYSIWDRTLEQYGEQNQQVYLTLARTLEGRRAFDRAIDIYRDIRSKFGNSPIITSELADVLLQAGNYEESIREYLELVRNNPERISHVQTRLLRFRDDYLYDIAILEIGDFLEELPDNHAAGPNLHQLELWLMLERGLHERALVKAKNYEERTSRVNYMLYSIGSKLLAEHEFDLAAQAYGYYVDNNIHPVIWRSMEELAGVYSAWATYLEQHNLAFSPKRDSLYRQAFDILNELKQNAPNYQRMERVLSGQAELALDVFHDPDQAERFLEDLKLHADTASAEPDYIQGRIHLYENDYARARIAFTRSRNKKGSGNLAEKARYYLALTDFFAGDYEFAGIQLNSIERLNTSYFANDALQLRLWIQQGLQADSTGAMLKPFARAVEYFSTGKKQLAVNTLWDIIKPGVYHPLSGEALLQLSLHVDAGLAPLAYGSISRFLESANSNSPLYERLMWEKARIADRVVTSNHGPASTPPDDTLSFDTDTNTPGNHSLPKTRDELIPLYEQILLQFPNGFYASHARERIRQLENIQT